MKLCDYELKVLRELNGENPEGMQWGAALSAALGFLCGSGLARKQIMSGYIRYVITDAGRAHLAALGAT